jgi:hypothetical protein
MPPIPRRTVSGRYRGRHDDFEAELRVDVDGARPMNRVSADYFQLQDDEAVYAGSMCVDAPEIERGRSLLTIRGRGRSSWETDADHVEVTIPDGSPGTQRASATLSHRTADGRVRARFECSFESASFRTVLLEEDSEQGVRRRGSYDTGALPAGCPPQTLTHEAAFLHAGIEFEHPRGPVVVEHSDVEANTCWTDAELHAAMVRQFSLFADVPQWAVWMFHARLHDKDRGSRRPRIYGLMFDQRGSPRQGCAVFYAGMAGSRHEHARTQLVACVHELGHCFNLLHSSQRSRAQPRSASWMTQPDFYPGGATAFWPRFAFQFDDLELVHLRHAFRDHVIMGGSAFAGLETGAALEAGQRADPGLRLKLIAPSQLPYGVPVTVAFELSGTTRDGRRASRVLGPRVGNVDVTVRRPDGTTFVFEPFLRHCRLDDTIVLCAGDQPVHDNAFIHYGKGGFAFDSPGRYELTAHYTAPGGALVTSDVALTDVRPPVTPADRAVTDLVFGDDQGALMSLVGSDAPALRSGTDALQTITERFPDHPVATVPRLVLATNYAREFKAIQDDGSIDVRESLPRDAAAMLRGRPGLEALRAAGRDADEVAPPQLVADLLRRVPTDRASAHVLHPYIHSRIEEIAAVLPQILAPGAAMLAPLTRGRDPA